MLFFDFIIVSVFIERIHSLWIEPNFHSTIFILISDEASWKGIHVSQLQTSLNHSQFPKLASNEEHTILFRVSIVFFCYSRSPRSNLFSSSQIPVSFEQVPECFPSIFNRRDFWDSNHVKLPCSEKNVTRVGYSVIIIDLLLNDEVNSNHVSRIE